MKICIVGAGAIGGYMGARLALAGQQVTLIARGAHLQAIQERGLMLQSEVGTVEVARPALATSDMGAAGPQDVVIVAVKVHSLAALAQACARCMARRRLCCRRRTASPGGISTSTAGHTKAGGSRLSTRMA